MAPPWRIAQMLSLCLGLWVLRHGGGGEWETIFWATRHQNMQRNWCFPVLDQNNWKKKHQTIFLSKYQWKGVCGNYQIMRTLPQNVTENWFSNRQYANYTRNSWNVQEANSWNYPRIVGYNYACHSLSGSYLSPVLESNHGSNFKIL